jgi:hypothetical protein
MIRQLMRGRATITVQVAAAPIKVATQQWTTAAPTMRPYAYARIKLFAAIYMEPDVATGSVTPIARLIGADRFRRLAAEKCWSRRSQAAAPNGSAAVDRCNGHSWYGAFLLHYHLRRDRAAQHGGHG